MSGLQQSDAGWYWCKTGDLQIPANVRIRRGNANSTTVAGNTETDLNGGNRVIWVLLAAGLGLLLILVSIITWMLRKKCNANQAKTREKSNNPAVEMASTTECPMIYSSVTVKKKKLSNFPALSSSQR
ncbi:hypothetical protein SRHO_G00239140 [Serrasalmus rhombeus]